MKHILFRLTLLCASTFPILTHAQDLRTIFDDTINKDEDCRLIRTMTNIKTKNMLIGSTTHTITLRTTEKYKDLSISSPGDGEFNIDFTTANVSIKMASHTEILTRNCLDQNSINVCKTNLNLFLVWMNNIAKKPLAEGSDDNIASRDHAIGCATVLIETFLDFIDP